MPAVSWPDDPAPNDDITSLAKAVTELSVSASCETLTERATRWVELRQLARELQVLVDEYAHDVGLQLADTDYDRADGWRLPDGTRIVHQQRSTERWEGRKLLRTLATEMIDPTTGEAGYAIPLVVLAEIVPGVADDKATSSKWKLGGLRNLDIDPDDFRTREWKPPRAELWTAR